jgi:hypothetical protein
MSTSTAFRNVEKALCERLGIRKGRAREIVRNRAIVSELDMIRVDMRDCVAVVMAETNEVMIHSRGPDGTLTPIESLIVFESDLKRWRTMPVDQAYGLPNGTRIAAA